MAIVYTDEIHYQNIANSIRAKNGETKTYTPSEMATAIDAISVVVEEGVDTSDATAVESDIKIGQIAYASTGKVVGTMPDNGAIDETLNAGDSYSVPEGYHNGSGIVKATSLSSQTEATATDSDIALGKTAWVNGTKITGVHEEDTLEDMTSDATATATDIKSGQTAYVNGELVTGNVSTLNTNAQESVQADSVTFENESITFQRKIPASRLYRYNSSSWVSRPASDFGDATAEDVASGKTFTSYAGLKVTGTAAGGIDPSQYTLFSTSTADASIIDYEDSNGYYSPGIKISASTLSGKSIYGFHLYVYYYDYDSDVNWCDILTYWNPSRTTGAEQMTLTALNMSTGKPTSDSLEFITRDDIGDFDVATMSGNYLSIAFEPLSSSVNAEWADLYSLERYLLKVWYL